MGALDARGSADAATGLRLRLPLRRPLVAAAPATSPRGFFYLAMFWIPTPLVGSSTALEASGYLARQRLSESSTYLDGLAADYLWLYSCLAD